MRYHWRLKCARAVWVIGLAVFAVRGPTDIARAAINSGAQATPQPATAIFLDGAVVDGGGKSVPNAQVIGRWDEKQSRTTADRSGHFNLGPFPRSVAVSVTATAGGFAPSQVYVAVSNTRSVLVRLERPGLFRGHVLDARTGRPLTSFRIAFYHPSDGPIMTTVYPGTRTFDAPDGRYQWHDMLPGRWTFRVETKGYQPLDVVGLVVRPGSSTEDFALQVERGRTLRGSVVDKSTGRAIRAATVSYALSGVQPGDLKLEPPRPSVTTGADGRFVLDDLPTAKLTLDIIAPGYATASLLVAAHAVPEIRVALGHGASIAGDLVTDDGTTPQAGSVRIFNALSRISVERPTDANGRFAATQLLPGRYFVRGVTSESVTPDLEVVLAEDQQVEGLVLAAYAGRTLHGQVSGLLPGESGEAVINLTVTRMDSKSGIFASIANRRVSAKGTTGSFVVHGIPAGKVTVMVMTALGRTLMKAVEVRGDEDPAVDFDFSSRGRVTGAVTRAGESVCCVQLSAQPEEGQSLHGSADTDAFGRYVFEGLAEGAYRISVMDQRAHRFYTRLVRVSGDTTFNFEVPVLSVSGRVVDADTGKALSDVEVGLESRRSSIYATTDYQGNFLIADVAPGGYYLSSRKRGYYADAEPRVSVDGSVSGLTVELHDATVGVEIRVFDAETSLPMTGVQVSVLEGFSGTVELDENGVGHLPASFIGRDLEFSNFEHAPATVKAWDGAPLVLQLGVRPR